MPGSETGSSAHPDAPSVPVEDYVYHLPEELIAAYPAEPRGSSRLLVRVTNGSKQARVAQLEKHVRENFANKSLSAKDGILLDSKFCDLEDILPKNAHLIMNQSKVFPARMYATNWDDEKPIEVMFLDLEKDSPNNSSKDTSEMLQKDCNLQEWRVMIRNENAKVGDKPMKAVRVDETQKEELLLEIVKIHSDWLEEEGNGVEATVRILMKKETGDSLPMADAFEHFGTVPLPPYLGRETEESDRGKYQTVYAKDNASGSVAAPTAGLHFTEELLQKIRRKGVQESFVNLHVGAGTFRPVTVNNIAAHNMHEEQFSVEVNTIRNIIKSINSGDPLIPVGTTSVRVLESLFWFGCLALEKKLPDPQEPLYLDQWEPYSLMRSLVALPSPEDALTALLDDRDVISGSTSICIAPGYKFQLCDGLITNFHQPHSTLMLLVGSLMNSSQATMQFYTHAVTEKYRFLSYGDASLILNAQDRL